MTKNATNLESATGTGHHESPSAVLPVAIAGLCYASVLDFSLYIRLSHDKPLKLYRGRDLPVDQADLDRLADRGITTLYITSSDRDAYQKYLRRQVIENERVAPVKRYKVLRESTRAVFETAFRQRSADMLVQCSAELGAQLATIICRQDLVLRDLFSLMDHDYYTYTHALNVATFSVALASRLQVTDDAALNALATGALLHDIGKRRVDLNILNKQGVLAGAERKQIEQHPRLGFLELSLREDLSWAQLMMIYQHHERPDGLGYPVGLLADDIHPWAQVCSVVDVFDALTAARSYREPLSLVVAVDHLAQRAGVSLNKEMVKCWKALVSCQA